MPSNSAESEAFEVVEERNYGDRSAVWEPVRCGLLACTACGLVVAQGKERKVCPLCGAKMGEILIV